MSHNTWPKRLYALDISRGFASLSVVLWHWQHFAYKGNSLPQNFERASQPLYGMLKIFYENGFLGVQYFFLLSGFIFFWLYKDSIRTKSTTFQEFWVSRFSRLYPLHLFTLLIVAFLQLQYITHEGHFFVYSFNDWYHFLLNLGFASNWGFESGWSFNAPVWSVSITVLLYLIFFLIASLRLDSLLFCLVTSSILSVVAILPFVHNRIIGGAALFFLGGASFHLCFLISTKHRKLKYLIYTVAFFCWAPILVHYYIFDLSGYVLIFGRASKLFLRGFPRCILFPITVCSLVLYEIDNGPILKSFSWVGDITYSSYLLHFPLQLLFGLAVSYGVLSPEFYLNPLYLGIFFIIFIPLSYITFQRFERPMQKMIRNKYYTQRSKQLISSTPG